MSDFKAKMHQIRFLLGRCPRPRCGSLQRSPRLPAGFKGLLLRGRKGGEGKGEGEGRDQEKGKGRDGKGEGGEGGQGWEGKFRRPGEREGKW